MKGIKKRLFVVYGFYGYSEVFDAYSIIVFYGLYGIYDFYDMGSAYGINGMRIYKSSGCLG